MSCPSPETLVTIAFDEAGADASVARHVRTCAACTAEMRRLREAASVLQLAQESGHGTASCVDELTIANIATGGAAQLDATTTAHLAECERCRAQLAGALATLQAPEISKEIERLEQNRSLPATRRVPNWARMTALAAALAGIALVPQLIRTGASDPATAARELRDSDPSITMTPPPRIIAPKGPVARAAMLTWTSVPGANRYAVTVFDKEGTVVWETETSDTAIALPPAVVQTHGNVYLWKVEAHTSWNRSAESELVEFRVNKQVR